MIVFAFIATPKTDNRVKADEFTYKEVDVVSIAPPTLREVFGGQFYHVIFVVYFDADITYANYKHMARRPNRLKETIGEANPAITEEAIDFFDQNGIINSINDCVYFNGKSIREYQAMNVDACMVHLGEEGVNNAMNIEFGTNIVHLSTDLDESYEISFKAGLKLPSGVMLEKDSDWKFMLSDRTFVRKDLSITAANTEFDVNYDGRVLTKTDNVITIKNKQDYSFDKFYIKPKNINSTITTETSFDKLQSGLNYVFISCTAEDGFHKNELQVVIDYVGEESSSGGGCSSGISSGFGVAGMLLAALFIRRKTK